MQLFDLIRNKKVLSEGGNVSSQSPGWQGAADQEAEEIDLKIHDRDHMVGQLRELLSAQNESFKAAYGKYIWDPKLLASGQMFSGSSLQFFDVKGVNTQDFLNKLKKTKVGDIDTQIDQDMGDEVTAWLKSIIGKKVGNGTFLGFNSSLSSIWLLDDPQVRIQVDYELGPYQPAQGKEPARPTEWFAYSHSSHYDDMAAGIKGVFHKYINRALTHAQKSTKYVARVLKKGVKISDEPVSDSDYSFAVSSAQGGGMSIKYKPYIDPATGQPMEKDGVPVMQLLDPKDRDYIQNLDQQFQMTYGRKRGAADRNLQGSFVGTLQLMNKSFEPEQIESVVRAFLDILFGPGAQMITKDDPARDRDVKFAAVDAMLLGGGGVKPLNLPNGQGLRQEAVKMAMDYADKFNAKRGAAPTTEVAEDAAAEIAAKPNYARQGIKHIYNRLPDGRVSSMEMKDAEFIALAKEIADNGGTLDGANINLKVDGAGIRFGKDSSGRPFFMTSKVTTPLYQDDVGYFTSFGQQRGQDAENLARTKKYDDALALITGSKFIQALPSDTIVQAEMLYTPMAEKTADGMKFVNISYDPAKLGGDMTLVPFMFKQFSTGEERPDADRILKKLLAASDNKVKIISNQLQQKGINVSKIIEPVLNLDPANKRANKEILDQARQQLSDAIYNSPKLQGKDALGANAEGIVINMPSGQLVKVTSPQMKSAMAAKLATPGAKRQGPAKTAVVAVGSFVGHKGHQELFNYTINKAKQLGGDPYLFMGNAVGKDDPIPVADKIKTWQQLYPQYSNNISATMEGGSLMQKIKHELINPMPGKSPKYDNIVIMVGEDQANMPIAGALMKAVNKFPGYEHVKAQLEVTPRGTGMSFTQLRNSLKTGDEQTAFNMWNDAFNGGNFGAQKLPADWIKHLMDISRKGMGVVQQPAAAPQAAPQPAPVAETRLLNALIRPSNKTKLYIQENNEIRKLQQYLVSKGAKISVDGVLGPKTNSAIQQFLKGDENFLQTGYGVATSGNGMPVRTGSDNLPTNKIPAAPAKQLVPSMSLNSDQDIMDMIKRHEGVKNKPYKDSLGLWTVGVGHLIGDGKTLPPEWNREFSDKEIMSLFHKDYHHHKEAAVKIPGYEDLNTNGKGALIDLTFNMGPHWFKKWPNFVKAISSGNVNAAAKELQSSKWFSQVGNRAKTIVGLIKNSTDIAESASKVMANTANSLENPPKVMQHRARRDMERDQQLKGRDIAKRNEEFNGEYDDEAGMAQSNLRTMARAVDGLLKTIKSNDNLPEWGQEKIAKAEMMLVSVWDYLQSQKELGMDPKVDMAEATSAAIRLQRAIERQRAKSDASLRRTPSSIPKPEPKKEQGVAEDANRTEAQADYMEGQCMVLAVAINQHNPKRYPIGYIWEYNMSAGAPDMQMDDDEWNDLSPEEQEEISNDISRHSVVHAYVRDQETNEYIDARGRHTALPNLWGRMGQTRFEEFPGTARELIDITAHGDWDEVGDQVNFKRGRPAFDSLAGPAGVKKALDYAVKYLGVVGPEQVKSPNVPQNQQGVAEGLSKRDQKDVAAIKAAIARLEAQLNHPNADRDAIQQSIAHEKKRLALYGQDVAEGIGSKLAGLGLAGAMALGSAGANARVTPGDDPNVNRLTGKPNVTQVAPSDVKPAASAGFNKEWLQKAADPNRTGRYMISVEKAQELLNKMNAVDEAKKKGVDGKACWKNYRYAGTENGKDKCVPVGEDVENIMGALIENLIRK